MPTRRRRSSTAAKGKRLYARAKSSARKYGQQAKRATARAVRKVTGTRRRLAR